MCQFSYKKFENVFTVRAGVPYSISKWKTVLHLEFLYDQEQKYLILFCCYYLDDVLKVNTEFKIIVAMIFLSSPWCKAWYTKLLPATKLMIVFYDNNQRRQGWFKVLNLDKRWFLTITTYQFSNHWFPQRALWRAIYWIFLQVNNLLVIQLTYFCWHSSSRHWPIITHLLRVITSF